MQYLGLFLIVLFFVLNLNAPIELSSVSKTLLIGDLLGVLFFGRIIIQSSLPENSASLRKTITTCFLWFLGMELAYLYFCWTPYLSPLKGVPGQTWGFDPQRYYWFAIEYLKYGSTDVVQNYMGVVYIYKWCMYVFGIDPMIPMFLNSIVLLFAICNISETYIQYCKKQSLFILKCLPLFFFIPDILAYGVMSSREVLSTTFSTICLSFTIRYVFNRRLMDLFKAFIAIILLFIIRPPFGVVAIAATIFAILLYTKRSSKVQIVVLALLLGICTLALGASMNSSMGSNTQVESLGDSFSDKIAGNNEKNEEMHYSTNSLAAKLIPHNPIEFIVFGAIRCVTYLIPKQNILKPLIGGNPYDTFGFFSEITSLLLMLFIPALWWVFKNVRLTDVLHRCTCLFLLLYLFVVGFGVSTFIQDRYRIVFEILYMFTAILTIDKMGGWVYYKKYASKFILFVILYVIILFIR